MLGREKRVRVRPVPAAWLAAVAGLLLAGGLLLGLTRYSADGRTCRNAFIELVNSDSENGSQCLDGADRRGRAAEGLVLAGVVVGVVGARHAVRTRRAG